MNLNLDLQQMDSEGDPFLRALGTSEGLPEPVGVLHSEERRYTGRCSITRGRGVFVNLMLRMGRFPNAGDDLPVSLDIRQTDELWMWDRDFAGHQTCSCLFFDHRRGWVREQIGGLTIWLQPVLRDTGLAIEIRRLCLFGIPCPGFMLPRSASTESQDVQGRFRFEISASVPVFGLLIRYQGWLTPDHAGDTSG